MVDAVTQLGRTGVHVGLGVVAVVRRGGEARGLVTGGHHGGGVAVAVEVGIDVPGRCVRRVLVGGPVTVLVDAVAGLRGVGVHAVEGVVTVLIVGEVARGRVASDDTVASVAEAVPVGVSVPGRGVPRGVVDGAVTIFVDAVARLGRAGMDATRAVVAVRVVGDVVGGGIASGHRGGGVAEAVAIEVCVPGGGVDRALVQDGVTVFVHVVAGLGGARVDAGGAVIAVARVRHVAAGRGAFVHRRRGVAEAVPVVVRVEGRRDAVIHDRVAVLVYAVTHLGRVRTHARRTVVALLTGGPPVAIGVHVAHRTVTIVVHGVRAVGLGGAGVYRSVAFVAVAVGRREAVAAVATQDDRPVPVPIPVIVGVPGPHVSGVLVGLVVAVLVHPVTHLVGAGVHTRGGVVTIAALLDGPLRGVTRGDGVRPVPVAVSIDVPGGGVLGVLVDLIVAIVVAPVAELGGVRVGVRVRVVTIDLGGVPIAVVVYGTLGDRHVGAASCEQHQEAEIGEQGTSGEHATPRTIAAP